MAVTLTVPSLPAGNAAWSTTNAGMATDTGDLTWTVTDSADGANWLCYMETPAASAAAGQQWTVQLAVASPTGPGFPVLIGVAALNAGGSTLTIKYGTAVTTTAAAQVRTLTMGPMPAGTSRLRVYMILGGATPAANRTMTLSAVTVQRTATADDVLSCRLDRPLNATVIDGGVTVIAQGPAAAPTVTLSFLHPTLDSARDAEDVLRTYTVTVAAPGEALDGLTVKAIGRIQTASERTYRGLPARWVQTVEVKEL